MSLAIATEPVPLATDTDGVVRVGGTRVTLDTVIRAFLDGATAEGIVDRYPSLQLADVYSTVGYYLRRRAEVDAYLDQRRQQSVLVRQENERRFPPDGIRNRLLSRRNDQG